MWILCIMSLNQVREIVFCTTAVTRGSQIRSRILSPSKNKVNLPYSRTYILWRWLSITTTVNMTVNAIMPDKQKKKLLSLTFRSKEKLPLLVISQSSRIRQIHLHVIRQVCGQTLARVRVRTDINSSIIISLQQRKGT